MKRLVAYAVCAAFVAGSAQAAPVVYKFTGTLTSTYQFSAPIPEWQFAAGQSFSGTLVYDSAAITSSWDYIHQPDWTLTFYYSPLVKLSFDVALPGGSYHYDVPTQGPTNSAQQYVAVGQGTGGWTGVSIRTLNYPAGGRSGPPSAPVPPESYVGPYNPHMVEISLANGPDSNPHSAELLADTSPNVDLVKLHDQLIGPYTDYEFFVRFSDSYAWTTPGVEHLDAGWDGRIDKLWLVSEVPEAPTWALLFFGIGAAGAMVRFRRRKICQVA